MNNLKRMFLMSITLVVAGLLFAPSAFAVSDPPGCTSTGVTLTLTAYRVDEVTPIGANTIHVGETITYQALLQHAGGDSCNFEGGSLLITTPDGLVTDVTPPGEVPLVTNTTPFYSDFVLYVVSAADANGGILFADATYANGTSLLGDGVSPVGATTPTAVFLEMENVTVEKTAETFVTQQYIWSIEKSANETSIILNTGETVNVSYDVMVDVEDVVESGWSVSGEITITNPSLFANATVEGVSDELTGGIMATVDCGEAFPIVIPVNSSLVCTYQTAVPNSTTRTNTATVTTSGDVGGGVGMAEANFENATQTVIDDVINVTDTFAGDLGLVDAQDAPQTFTYERTVGPFNDTECGEQVVDNTAMFETMDSQTTGESSVSIPVTVECPVGCTLTQGYWKTHSQAGPAPYDEAWQNLGVLEEETIFYLSGQTWLEVFKTAPKGTAYYNLAHQYMAAVLNSLTGAATTPAVDAALTDAEALFNTYTPAQVAAWKGKQGERQEFISLAGILGSYNEGAIGPGHCEG